MADTFASTLRQTLSARLARLTQDEWSRPAWARIVGEADGPGLRELLALLDAASAEGPPEPNLVWWMRHRLVEGAGQQLDLQAKLALLRAQRRRVLQMAEIDALIVELSELEVEARARHLAARLPPPEVPSLEGVHSVLAHALRAAPFEQWPPGPFHDGGLRPDIGAVHYEVLARHLAKALAHHSELSGWLEASASREAGLARGRADAAGGSLRPTLAKVVKAIVASGDARSFLELIDPEMLRLDAVMALQRRKKTPSTPIVRSVWRGARPKGDRIHAWLVELSDHSFGYLGKIGRRFAWHEGPLEEMLALVPDAHFEEAVLAAGR